MTVPPGRAGRISRRGLLATFVAVGAATSSCTRSEPSGRAPTRQDIERLTADWTRAVLDQDWALYDQTWTGAVEQVQWLWHSLAGLGLTEFTVTPELSTPIRGTAATMRISWRVPGDRAAARHTLTVPLEHRHDRWRFSAPASSERGPGPCPLWWVEPTRTHSVGDVCVIAGDARTQATVLRCAEAATAALDEAVRLTGLASTGVVLELPSTPQVLDIVLGDDRGSSGQLSALTWPEGPRVEEAPLRILLNPLLADAAADSLGQVLTHEITHLLTAAPERTVPLWVAEGYAELVGWDGDVDGGWQAAEPFLARVRAGQLPRTPPSDEMFAGPELRIAYGQAWTLCRWLLEETSWQRVNRWYAALREGAAMDDALRDVGGPAESELMNSWQGWLHDRSQER